MVRILNNHPELTVALSALCGIEATMLRRVVIDIQANHAPIVHIERWGDESLIDVVRTLAGVEVMRSTGETTERSEQYCGAVGRHRPHDWTMIGEPHKRCAGSEL